MANKKSPQQTSPWDLEAFEHQVYGDSNWSQSSAKRKVNRVQDLGLSNLDSAPSSPRNNTKETSSSWPFESSPCRMFGGKNTRPSEDGESSSKNELFDIKFADRSFNKRIVSDTDYDEAEETSIEEDFESEDLILDESEDSESSGGGGGGVIETADHGAIQHRQRTSARRSSDRSRSPSANKDAPTVASQSVESVARTKSASPTRVGADKKNRSSKMKRNSLNNAQAKPTQKVEKKQSPPKKTEKPKVMTGIDKLTRTEKPNRKKLDKPRSTVDDSQVSSSQKEGSRFQRGLNRAKSSDGMEGLAGASEHTLSRKGGKRDDLSTASFHTSASLGRSARSLSLRRDHSVPRGGTPKPSLLDRRSKFARAMSTSNVKRPEEYAHHETKSENKITNFIAEKRRSATKSSSAAVAVRESEDVAAGTEHKGENTQFISEKRKTSKHSSSASVEYHGDATGTDDSASAPAAAEDVELQIPVSRTRPTVRPKRSGRLGSRSGSSSNLSQQKEGDGKSISSNTALSSSSNQKSPKRATRERRDLMVLLRERKSIQAGDLLDKENRKLLHFLMYEHKMGLSQQELRQRIQQEKD